MTNNDNNYKQTNKQTKRDITSLSKFTVALSIGTLGYLWPSGMMYLPCMH